MSAPDLFTFSMEDVQRAMEQSKLERAENKRDPRICKCGHGARVHTSEAISDNHRELRAAGRFMCTPGRQKCPCQKFEPVMIAGDVRRFIFRTEGPAEKHALARGAMKSWEDDTTVEWIPGTACDGCQTQGVQLAPLALDVNGRVMNRPSVINVLACADCRSKLPV